jgi:hypothetical protein
MAPPGRGLTLFSFSHLQHGADEASGEVMGRGQSIVQALQLELHGTLCPQDGDSPSLGIKQALRMSGESKPRARGGASPSRNGFFPPGQTP